MPEILLIEDDEALAKNLVRYLQTEGYTVHTADGQKKGLQLFGMYHPDCVLLDVSLADGNGFSVCSAIRQTIGRACHFPDGIR